MRATNTEDGKATGQPGNPDEPAAAPLSKEDKAPNSPAGREDLIDQPQTSTGVDELGGDHDQRTSTRLDADKESKAR